jgi:hypothetical protein
MCPSEPYAEGVHPASQSENLRLSRIICMRLVSDSGTQSHVPLQGPNVGTMAQEEKEVLTYYPPGFCVILSIYKDNITILQKF